MPTVITPPSVAASIPTKEYLVSTSKTGGKQAIQAVTQQEVRHQGEHSGVSIPGATIVDVKPEKEMSTGAKVAIGVAAAGVAVAAGWALLAGGGLEAMGNPASKGKRVVKPVVVSRSIKGKKYWIARRGDVPLHSKSHCRDCGLELTETDRSGFCEDCLIFRKFGPA